MTLQQIKKIIIKNPVKKWIEAGVNVIEIGDKLLNKNAGFSRLDYYAKNKALQFCAENGAKAGRGGCITLENNNKIYYNVK